MSSESYDDRVSDEGLDDAEVREETANPEEDEEEQIETMDSKKIGKNYISWNGNFQTRYLSSKVEYSLTRHLIKKPRKLLFKRQDYVVAGDQIYEIESDMPLPEVGPGFSYSILKKQTVKAIAFAPQQLDNLLDRCLYMPGIIPVDLRIGDIKHFTSVFEPNGEDVEVCGIFPSLQALELMEADFNKNLVVPQALKVERTNVVVGKQFKHCLCFAKENINEHVSLQCSSSEYLDVNALISKALESRDRDVVLELLRKQSQNLSTFTKSQISQKFVLRQVISEQHDIIEAVTYYQRLYVEVNIILQQVESDSLALQLLNLVYRCADTYPCFCSVTSSMAELPLSKIEEVYKIDCKVLDVVNKTVEQLKPKMHQQMPFNVLEEYKSYMRFALCCKNENYLKFILENQQEYNAQRKQLMEYCQVKTIRSKDIKCTCTPAALLSGKICPLEVAAFYDAKGIYDLSLELDFSEYLEKDVRDKYKVLVDGVLYSCACNVKDNVSWMKRYLELFKEFDVNLDYLLTAAFISKNRKIFSYLSMKRNLLQNFSFGDARYLVTGEHLQFLKQIGLCTVESLKNLSFMLPDNEICQLLEVAICNGTYRLYNNELLEDLLLQNKQESSNLILKAGFSFPSSQFNYHQVCLLGNDQEILELVELIIEQFNDLEYANFFDAFSRIIFGCIVNKRLPILELIVRQFEEHISQEKITQNRDLLLGYLQEYEENWHIYDSKTLFGAVNDLSSILNNKLVDSSSITELENLTIKQFDNESIELLVQCCEQYNGILQSLDVRTYWECYLGVLLLKNTEIDENTPPTGVMAFAQETARVFVNEVFSMSINNEQQTVNVTKIHLEILEFVISNKKLYKMTYQSRYFEELIAPFVYKFDEPMIEEFISNFDIMDYDITRNALFEKAANETTLFDEINNKLSDNTQSVLAPIAEEESKITRNTMQSFTIENNVQLLSEIIQLFIENEDRIGMKESAIYDIATTVSNVEEEKVEQMIIEICESALPHNCEFAALFGLVVRNPNYLTKALAMLWHDEEFLYKFLDYEYDNKLIVCEVVGALTSQRQFAELNQLFELQKLGELIEKEDGNGETPFTYHLNNLQDSKELCLHLLCNKKCNKNNDNWLHLTMRKFSDNGRKNENLRSNEPTFRFGAQQEQWKNNDIELNILNKIETKLLKQYIVQTNAANETPVHYIDELKALELVSQLADIKQIDSEKSLFMYQANSSDEVIIFLYQQECDLCKELTPAHTPHEEKFPEERDFLYQLIRSGRKDVAELIYKNKIVDEELFIQHSMVHDSEQHRMTMQPYYEDFKYATQPRTAELYMRLLTTTENNVFIDLERNAAKFGLFNFENLMALTEKVFYCAGICALLEEGDLQLSSKEIGQLIKKILEESREPEDIKRCFLLIDEENASGVIQIVMRLISKGEFNNSLNNIITHIIDSNYLATASNPAIKSIIHAFIEAELPPQNDEQQLKLKVILFNMLDKIPTNLLVGFEYQKENCLSFIKNSYYTFRNDEFVERFIAKLESLGIAYVQQDNVPLNRVELVDIAPEQDELYESFCKLSFGAPKLSALRNTPSENYKIDEQGIVWYKNERLSFIGIQEQFNFNQLQYSLVKVELRHQNGRFRLLTSFEHKKLQTHLQELWRLCTPNVTEYSDVVLAYSALQKYLTEKSGYQYSVLMKQLDNLGYVAMRGKFRFVTTIVQSDEYSNKFDSCKRKLLEEITEQLDKKPNLIYEEIIALLQELLCNNEENLRMCVADVQAMQQLENEELQNYLLINYNTIVSQRLLKDYRSVILMHYEQSVSRFALFERLYYFAISNENYTYEELLQHIGIQLGEEIIELPNSHRFKEFLTFPELYPGSMPNMKQLMYEKPDYVIECFNNLINGYGRYGSLQGIIGLKKSQRITSVLNNQEYPSNVQCYRNNKIELEKSAHDAISAQALYDDIIPIMIQIDHEEED